MARRPCLRRLLPQALSAFLVKSLLSMARHILSLGEDSYDLRSVNSVLIFTLGDRCRANSYWVGLMGYSTADMNKAFADIAAAGGTTVRTW